MKKLIKVMMMSLLALGFLAGCGSEGADDHGTAQDNTLIVGIDDTFAPMSFRDNDGKIVGFDVDIAEEVSKVTGYKLQFQPIDWALKETELNQGNIDLIWNGYTITPTREKQVAFSVPYMTNSQMIVTLADSGIEKKADLAGKTVSAQQSSSAVQAIMEDDTGIMSQFAGGEPVQYPTNNDVFNDLISGRADAIVVDETMGRYFMSQNANYDYKVLEDNFGEEEYAVGMRKEDTDLKEKLDDALEEVVQSDKYDEIFAKWFAEE